MTLRGARLTLEADVNEDGTAETGVFDLGAGIEISPRIRTGQLIGPTGSNIGALVDTIVGESGRAGFQLDAGGGALVIDISFRGYEGSDGRWGDGSADDQADAEGEGVFRQISVLIRYLNRGTYDSRDSGTLEWGEYSSGPDAAYGPLNVAPEEPQLTFAAEEQTSTFDGSLSLVTVRSIEAAVVSQQQDPNR